MLTLVEAYEANHFPVGLLSPIDAIKFRMEQSGLSASGLSPAIERPNRMYEVLNGTRSLTLPMIWELHSLFGIPVESLIKPVLRGRLWYVSDGDFALDELTLSLRRNYRWKSPSASGW